MKIELELKDIDLIADKIIEKLLPLVQVQQTDKVLVADNLCPKKKDLSITRAVKPRMLSIRESATYLGIAEKTLRNRLGSKADNPFPLKPKHIGGKVLFDVKDLDAYLDKLPTT